MQLRRPARHDMRNTASAGSNKCIPTKSERGNDSPSLRKAGTKLATNSRQAIRVGLRHLMGPWQAARSGREERCSARALDAKAEQLPESRAIRRRAFSSP